LEEMLQVQVSTGAIFYGGMRRRETVVFDQALRDVTVDAARRFHDMLASGQTPVVAYAPKCRSCSLLDICIPPRRRGRRSAKEYLVSAVAEGDG